MTRTDLVIRMNQNVMVHPFEDAKNKISDSSRKLYRYTLWATFLGFALAIILIISLFAILIPLGFVLEEFDLDNIYESGEALIASNFLTTGLVAAIFLVIVLVALIIVMIMIYVQYYRLASGFNRLHNSDPRDESTKYISYGIYGYVIAVIAGIFIPGTVGNVVTALGNVSLAIGVYLIYKLFGDYKNEGRFKGKPSVFLFIGLGIQAITSISSIFNEFVALGGLLGFILMLLGFRDLSRDIRIVDPPSDQGIPAKIIPDQQYVETAPITSEPSSAPASVDFCSKCGAKITTDGKFCQSCGAAL